MRVEYADFKSFYICGAMSGVGGSGRVAVGVVVPGQVGGVDEVASAPNKDGVEDGGMPRDAKIIMQILDEMGVEDYEPRVVHALLELQNRFTMDLVNEALGCAEHAGRLDRSDPNAGAAITPDDVRMAIRARSALSTGPPPREHMLQLAAARNSIPLPPGLHDARGIILPPEEFRMTAPNFQIQTHFGTPGEQEERSRSGKAGGATVGEKRSRS